MNRSLFAVVENLMNKSFSCKYSTFHFNEHRQIVYFFIVVVGTSTLRSSSSTRTMISPAPINDQSR